MAWMNRSEEGKPLTKEELKAAGVDVDALSTLSAQIGNAATKEEVTAVSTQLASIVDSLKALEGRLPEPKVDTVRTAPTELDAAAFIDNPTAAIKSVMSTEIQALTAASINTAASLAYRDAQSRYPHFKRYETEIKEMWDKQPIQYKAQADDLIKNIYNMVVGQHTEELATEYAKNGGRFNVVQAGGGGQSNADTSVDTRKPEDKLTEQELKIAKGLGMTPEQYAKNKEVTYA